MHTYNKKKLIKNLELLIRDLKSKKDVTDQQIVNDLNYMLDHCTDDFNALEK